MLKKIEWRCQMSEGMIEDCEESIVVEAESK